jgi:type II secretory pathway pseudopilin PulG
MTLIELTVAMFVSGVVAAVVASVMIGSLRAAKETTGRTNSAADARIAMETVSRTLRVAVIPERELSAVTVAQPDAITFYALLNRSGTSNPLPTKVEYYRDATSNCLVQALTPARTLTPPTAADPLYAWDTGRQTKCVVRTTDVPTVADPWFSYYTDAALSKNGVAVQPLPPAAANLTLAQRQDVVSVALALTVTDPAHPEIKGVSDVIRVTLSNVSLAGGGAA